MCCEKKQVSLHLSRDNVTAMQTLHVKRALNIRYKVHNYK